MRDLFSDLPLRWEVDGNYATRKAHQWIVGDSSLDEQCRACAEEWLEMGDHTAWMEDGALHPPRNALTWMAEELHSLVVPEALAVERSGLFFDLFTTDVSAIDWCALVTFYLESVAEEGRNPCPCQCYLAGAFDI